MKVSVSTPPDATPARASARAMPWSVAAFYLIAHLPFLAPSLEDVDSINFALGLREFDPAQHQPHPPGYPVYIALGRISLAAVNAIWPSMSTPDAEAWALAFWSALAGAAAVVFAARVFSLMVHDSGDGVPARVGAWGAAVLAVAPLYWFSGLRPMSDMPGLAAALGAQALLLMAYRDGGLAALASGAFLSAFSIGLRSQVVWLTMPLLLWVLAVRGRRRPSWLAISLGMYGVGALAWAVPLVVASGGWDAYLAALSTQAGEDFAFVDMLWLNPTPRRLALSLVESFSLPWASPTLATAALAAAAAGAAVLLVRDRTGFSLFAVAFLPYTLFHLVFQETFTVRYALPVVVPVAGLAARAFAVAGARARLLAVPFVAGGLLVSAPAMLAYGRLPHPAFRALADLHVRAEVTPPGIVTSHYELRRALRAVDAGGLPVVLAPVRYEWLELANYWRDGGRKSAWFLANPRRTDLALIDPASRRDVVRYDWAVEGRPELGGTRPTGVDWYRLAPPGWFVGRGWSLTPEAGGVARLDGMGPDHAPITAWVRGRPDAVHAMVGGRHLGEASDGAARIELAVGGAVVDAWTLTHEDRNFLRFLDLRAGIPAAPDAYAELTLRAVAADGSGRRVPVAVRQFDVQSTGRVIFGFGRGWHEAEYDPATGRQWRWSSDRSILQIKGPERAVQVTVRGESPRRYFNDTPTVSLRAADTVVGTLTPSEDFDWSVTVPAGALAAAGGELALTTSQTFVPADRDGSPDTRRLGLRIFDVRVQSVR